MKPFSLMTVIKRLTLVVALALLTVPLWGEALHHHIDLGHHVDCHFCNSASATTSVTQPTSAARPVQRFITLAMVAISVVFPKISPLQWSPSHSPPAHSL